MDRLELLIPAGNLEKLRTAVLYGADAVYIGVPGLSLRAEPAEISLQDLEIGINEAHQRDVMVYGAINTFARNSDLDLLKDTIPQLVSIGIDGLILSDPGVLRTVRRLASEVPIHLSTQANTTNAEAVKFWMEQGVQRIVLARELSLDEIAEIKTTVPEMELELFVHGAMCVAYSGRCFLSAYRNRRSSNRGDCTQPCRWEYQLVESTRPDQPLYLEADDRYSYLLSSKDLCMIEYLPQLAAAGVDSLKIEGRMKSAYYVAVVSKIYREALDELHKDPAAYQCRAEWLEELGKISNRGYTTGFYFATEKITELSPEVKYLQTHDLVGTVLKWDQASQRILVGVRNYLTAGDELELLLPKEIVKLDSNRATDEHGLPVSKAHNGYQVYFPVTKEIPVGAVLRRKLSRFS